MGTALCHRLLDLGYNLTVMANRSRTGVEEITARGGVEVATPREIAASSDIILLCMDTSISVEGRMYGDDGVIAGLQSGAVVIDFGTSLPGSTREIGKAVSDAGGSYLDAPMGRTPTHAREGKVNFMCSGEKAAFDKSESTLRDMAENVFLSGRSGHRTYHKTDQ